MLSSSSYQLILCDNILGLCSQLVSAVPKFQKKCINVGLKFKIIILTPNDKTHSRIPSGTDGWMEYVPISEKKNVSVAAPQQIKEGKP